MKNFLTISIHYDYVKYGPAETATMQTRTPLCLCQLLKGDFTGLREAADWISCLGIQKPFVEVFVIIPYNSYLNKSLGAELEKTIGEKWSAVKVRILSDVEAIAYFLICNDYLDGRYKVTALEESTVTIHYIDIRQNTFRHILSSEIPWMSLKLPRQVIGRQAEIPPEKDFDNMAMETLNRIYTEEFFGMDERYHCYRVEYGSSTTYGDLKRTFRDWADEYRDIVRSANFLDNTQPVKEIYCGLLSELQFFTEFAIGRVETINPVLIKSFTSNGRNIEDIYPATTFDVVLKTFSPEEHHKVLVKQGMWRQNISPEIPRTHSIRLTPTLTQPPAIVIKYGKTVQEYVLSSACWMQLSNTIPHSQNGLYGWIETEISASVDGCQNLVLHFKGNHTIVLSEIIGKI